ncbi:MAG: DUF2961 domain-containing protein [Bacillota bacterium]|nr:DUF2961 domain-containing protein [Bacillota bacterium]
MDIFMKSIYMSSDGVTRSISAENFKGEKGKGGMASKGINEHNARELGIGWKVSPAIYIKPGATAIIAEIEGSGVINHMWFTCDPKYWRSLILRIYWDGEENPSVEVPLGDFFCNGWCERSNVNSIPIAVNPAGGFNSYWPMPFRKSARITIENVEAHKDNQDVTFFYQITWQEKEVEDQAMYFHGQWRRRNPAEYKEEYVVVDEIKGKGKYVGTYIAWQANNNGWWGEGELKFFIDGDKEYPTICGTGTEDYVGGAWCFDEGKGEYSTYSTAFLGFHQVIKPDGMYKCNLRMGMYRWHILDSINFNEDLKITLQLLGWRSGARYLPLQDDIATTSFWYQIEPHHEYPMLPDANYLEVI